MDELFSLLSIVTNLKIDLQKIREEHFEELDQIFGNAVPVSDGNSTSSQAHTKAGTSVTPQQTKKRAKRLSSLTEVDINESTPVETEASIRSTGRISNNKLLAVAEDEMNNTATLMPPPPVPDDTTLHTGRPQRAAKLRSEKNLKEPSLGTKLRRPTTEVPVKVKLEHEQRASQFGSATSSHAAVASFEEKSQMDDGKSLNTDDEKAEDANITKNLRVKIKREKFSNGTDLASTANVTVPGTTHSSNSTFKAPIGETATKPHGDESAILSTTTASVPLKKGRKKPHRPIKVEDFSDLDKKSPISSRTRTGNTSKRNSQGPQHSFYEDAVEVFSNECVILPECVANEGVVNETVTISNATIVMGLASNNTTFNLPTKENIGDATFAVESLTIEPNNGSLSSNKLMETAKDGSIPQPQSYSLMTEDESQVDQMGGAKAICKLPAVKPLQMPTRTHELFNPLLQSPVKMRVEAFENVVNGQSGLRSKRTKEQLSTPGSNTTPVIGKLPAPTLGRFLTPTQASTIAPFTSAQPKKAPMSASKVVSLVKTSTGTNLKTTNSSSTKTMPRENSGEDFRRGLHQLAEERRKQREQKHLLAAQQREAKERERAERMAKLAKEREEKRIKKQQEENERKKQEMEEHQRKLRHHDDADTVKKTKAKEQEREMLHQIKLKQENTIKSKQMMMPPPPKSKYTFEMLHEDDSTDDEGKVTYKRPPAPAWSRSHVRGAAISMQSYCPTDVIDSFFSVAPTTIDLKSIFPNIDPRHLKRNSSVLWSTPPRYSELPKY